MLLLKVVILRRQRLLARLSLLLAVALVAALILFLVKT